MSGSRRAALRLGSLEGLRIVQRRPDHKRWLFVRIFARDFCVAAPEPLDVLLAQSDGLDPEVVDRSLAEHEHRHRVQHGQRQGEPDEQQGDECLEQTGHAPKSIGHLGYPPLRRYNLRVNRLQSPLSFVGMLRLIVLGWFLMSGGAAFGQLPEPAQGTREVTVSLDQFGLGDVVRPGDWAGVQLSLTNNTDRPRAVLVRFLTIDGDGDQPTVQRLVTLTPGLATQTWLYLRLPPSMQQAYTVIVNEASVREDGEASVGRQLGWAPVQPRIVRPAEHAMIAIVGESALGLDQYADTMRNEEFSITANEATTVVTGLQSSPSVFPDDWKGWAPFEAVVWSRGDVTQIGGDAQSQALREWIVRGGHLVIVLPPVGDTWYSAQNPLADLLPRARVRRVEGASLEPYRWLLTRPEPGTPQEELPPNGVIHRFDVEEGTDPSEATELFRGPHGVVALRRILGDGMVTVIGLDLSSRPMIARRILRADAFWHRVLGKRFDVLSQDERERHSPNVSMLRNAMEVMRPDRTIARDIAKASETSLGLLIAVVVFIAYWLTAGPVGFAVLKRFGIERHAWLVFFGVSVVFTGVAWVGASMLRQRETSVEHVTFLNHVYGQPTQRTRTWASVFLPEYGEQRITVGVPDSVARWSNAITPWTDPMSSSFIAFPDARPYAVNVRGYDGLLVPARSTIKQLQFDWVGAPRWSMPVPVSEDARPRLTREGGLVGGLSHGLPGPLRNVKVILVERQLTEAETIVLRSRRDRAPLQARAWSWSLPNEWPPESLLDLSQFEVGPNASAQSAAEYIKTLARITSAFGITTGRPGPDSRDYERLALYSVLEQPEYWELPSTQGVRAAVVRRLAHGLDLGKWFTQPSLIIYGEIESAESPTPIQVDGRPVRSTGLTVVRWVYPLGSRPIRFDGGAARPGADGES